MGLVSEVNTGIKPAEERGVSFMPETRKTFVEAELDLLGTPTSELVLSLQSPDSFHLVDGIDSHSAPEAFALRSRIKQELTKIAVEDLVKKNTNIRDIVPLLNAYFRVCQAELTHERYDLEFSLSKAKADSANKEIESKIVEMSKIISLVSQDLTGIKDPEKLYAVVGAVANFEINRYDAQARQLRETARITGRDQALTNAKAQRAESLRTTFQAIALGSCSSPDYANFRDNLFSPRKN